MEKLLGAIGFPGGSVVKNLTATAGDLGSILGREDPPRDGNLLQYSCLDILGRGAWWATVYGIAK